MTEIDSAAPVIIASATSFINAVLKTSKLLKEEPMVYAFVHSSDNSKNLQYLDAIAKSKTPSVSLNLR